MAVPPGRLLRLPVDVLEEEVRDVAEVVVQVQQLADHVDGEPPEARVGRRVEPLAGVPPVVPLRGHGQWPRHRAP